MSSATSARKIRFQTVVEQGQGVGITLTEPAPPELMLQKAKVLAFTGERAWKAEWSSSSPQTVFLKSSRSR